VSFLVFAEISPFFLQIEITLTLLSSLAPLTEIPAMPACGQRVPRLHGKRAASSIDVNNLRRPKFGTHIAH
jgi:hypothetical protein